VSHFWPFYLVHFRDLPDLGLFFTIQHLCAILFSKPGGEQKIIIFQYYSHTESPCLKDHFSTQSRFQDSENKGESSSPKHA
jgi:hypothetical protein